MPSRRVARRVRSSARVNASSVRRRRHTERAPEPNIDTNEPEVQPWYRRFWNYQPDPEAGWVQVVEQTGIPGVVEIARPNRHVTIRFYWVFVSLLIVMCASGIIGWGVERSNENPVQVTIQTGEVFTALIPYPATDLALLKGFKKSQMDEYRKIEGYIYQTDRKRGFDKEWSTTQFHALSYCVAETCESTTSASSRIGISNMEKEIGQQKYAEIMKAHTTPFYDHASAYISNFKIVPFLKKSITSCDQLVLGCIWSGDQTNCADFFVSSYSNFGGGTCSHNMMPAWVLRRDLTIQFMLETTMNEMEGFKWLNFTMDDYFFAVMYNVTSVLEQQVPLRQAVAGQPTGLTLILASNPNDYVCPQQDSDGVKIGVRSIINEPNVRKSGLVAPWNHETFLSVIPDVTLSNRDLKDIPIEKRGCAFDGEIILKFYLHYSRENCIQERLSKEIYAKCNCTLISSPKEAGSAICNLKQLRCAKEVEVKVFNQQPEDVYKECLPRCNDVKYNTKLSSTPFSNDTAEQFRKHFNLSEGTLTAVIHVFMEDVSVMVKIRSVKYDTFDKVGLFAGIMGFTTGTSFMTIAYLIAAFILMLFLIIKWLYKRYQAKLFPFHKRSVTVPTVNPIAPEAVNGVEPVVDINAVEPFSNAEENIAGHSQPDDTDMAIFTIRNVPGPEPNEPISRNTVFQYIP